MNRKKVFCRNRECNDDQRPGDSHVVKIGTVLGKRGRQRYLCRRCGKSFSIRTGTVFHRLKAPKKDFIEAIQMMVEGNSLAAISRVKGVSELTVSSWFRKVAEHCIEFSDQFLWGLGFTQCQIDDFWSFVKKKKSISRRVKIAHK